MITKEDWITVKNIIKHNPNLGTRLIASYLNLSRNTIRKVIKSTEYWGNNRKKLFTQSKVDKFKDDINNFLKANHVTGISLFKGLRNKGYQGGTTILNSYVAKIKKEQKINMQYHIETPTRLIPVWMIQFLLGSINLNYLNKIVSNKISTKELEKLCQEIRNNSPRSRIKSLALLGYYSGITFNQLKILLNVQQRTLKNYIKKYKMGGLDILFENRWKKFRKFEEPAYKNAIFAIMHTPPALYGFNRTTWKISDIRIVMFKKGLFLAEDNISKIIKNEGYRLRKAKIVLTSNDPNYLEKVENIKEILSNLKINEKFFSIDELGPIAIKIHGGRSLVPKNQIKIVPQWQISKGYVIVTAALELSSNQITHFYSKEKNTKEMIKLLEILLENYADEECIYLSWDAASWHASKELYNKVNEINNCGYHFKRKFPIVKLAPLPNRAQFLNVIESVFSGMTRAIIHNSDYKSVNECKNAIDRYFKERNQKFMNKPKRAGNNIWGREIVKSEFHESNNCKDSHFR